MAESALRGEGPSILEPGHAIVWWLAFDDLAPSLWAAFEDLLDGAECERAERFRFAADRRAFIAAHGIGRALLAAHAGLDAKAVRFEVTAHGKPEVAAPERKPRWRLNLSHTRGLAAAALTLDRDIGVDVEWFGRDADTEGVAARMFAAREVRHVVETPAAQKSKVFLAYWTLKEAYMKAIGKGLAAPLRDFSFTLEPATLRPLAIAFEDPSLDPADWWVDRVEPTPGHSLAVALRRQADTPPKVRIMPAPQERILRLSGSSGA